MMNQNLVENLNINKGNVLVLTFDIYTQLLLNAFMQKRFFF